VEIVRVVIHQQGIGDGRYEIQGKRNFAEMRGPATRPWWITAPLVVLSMRFHVASLDDDSLILVCVQTATVVNRLSRKFGFCTGCGATPHSVKAILKLKQLSEKHRV